MTVDFPIVHKQSFYGGDRRRCWDWVRIVSAGQQYSLGRVGMNEPLHQLLLAPKCGDRVTVSHGLTKNDYVRRHAGNLCIAADPMAKAGFDLVKN